MKNHVIIVITFITLSCIASIAEAEEKRAAPPGLPSTGTWKQTYDGKTSSSWRTYTDQKTGAEVSFNPKSQEVRRSPVTGKYEVVQKEASESSGTGNTEGTKEKARASSEGFEEWSGKYFGNLVTTNPNDPKPYKNGLEVKPNGNFRFFKRYQDGTPDLNLGTELRATLASQAVTKPILDNSNWQYYYKLTPTGIQGFGRSDSDSPWSPNAFYQRSSP